MFRYAQAIDDRSFLRLGIHQCCLPQVVRIDMADLGYTLRGIFFYNLFQFFKAFGPGTDEFFICQALIDDHIHHTVGKCNVRTGF